MPVDFGGKDYFTVNERVAAVHEDKAEFEMVNHEIITIGDTGRWWYQVTIRVHGLLYSGTAEIKFKAAPNTADGKNPVECAETSAVGRALGFAGYGIVDSIASADEVARATVAEVEHNAPRQLRPMTPAPKPQDTRLATAQQMKAITQMCADFDCPEPSGDLTYDEAALIIKDLQKQALKRHRKQQGAPA